MLNRYIAAEFVDFIDIDIQDGELVPSSTLSVDEALEVLEDLEVPETQITWDLMIKNPEQAVAQIKEKYPENKIIVHQSAELGFLDGHDLIAEKIGVAINGKEKLLKKQDLYKRFHSVQLMTIQAGKQGQEFMPLAIEKSVALRNMGFEREIAIDGGVNLHSAEIIRLYAQEGLVNKVSVGSYFQKSTALELDYKKLLLALNLQSAVDY